MARRSETVSIALTPQEKEKWKAAVERTPFENLASFVRYSMETICDTLASVDADEELEIAFMTQPRSDGKRMASDGYFWPKASS